MQDTYTRYSHSSIRKLSGLVRSVIQGNRTLRASGYTGLLKVANSGRTVYNRQSYDVFKQSYPEWLLDDLLLLVKVSHFWNKQGKYDRLSLTGRAAVNLIYGKIHGNIPVDKHITTALG